MLTINRQTDHLGTIVVLLYVILVEDKCTNGTLKTFEIGLNRGELYLIERDYLKKKKSTSWSPIGPASTVQKAIISEM